jgi:hypothetical protein
MGRDEAARKQRLRIAYGPGARTPKERDKDRREKLRKIDPDTAAKLDALDAGIAELNSYTRKTNKSSDALEKSTKQLEALSKTPTKPKKKSR